jgi:hypothetical protein
MGVVRGSIPRESISFCRPLPLCSTVLWGGLNFFVGRPADWCCGGPCARFVHVGWARANMWSGYGELGALGSGCVGWGKAGRVRVRLVFLEGVYVWVVRSKR